MDTDSARLNRNLGDLSLIEIQREKRLGTLSPQNVAREKNPLLINLNIKHMVFLNLFLETFIISPFPYHIIIFSTTNKNEYVNLRIFCFAETGRVHKEKSLRVSSA